MQDAYNEMPWAMTSAIKVDLNGDGWTPPAHLAVIVAVC